MIRFRLLLALTLVVALLSACESDNEHFCARYNYVYNQLLNEKDLPSYMEMRQQLEMNMKDPKKKKEQAQFMLFVLDDWHNGIKPDGEAPREFCMRVQRWRGYRFDAE